MLYISAALFLVCFLIQIFSVPIVSSILAVAVLFAILGVLAGSPWKNENTPWSK